MVSVHPYPLVMISFIKVLPNCSVVVEAPFYSGKLIKYINNSPQVNLYLESILHLRLMILKIYGPSILVPIIPLYNTSSILGIMVSNKVRIFGRMPM